MAKSTKTAAAAPKPAAKAAKAAPKAATATAEKSEKIAKTQIIDMVADKTTLNKKQAGEAVASMLDVVVEALKGGKSVGLPGLGTFSVAKTAARQGVRPGTSEKITIPAGKKVRFKVASTLKTGL
ncbi:MULTISPECIES: HU family DNA-binding protein [Deinococcus]|uniref:DNA-binding protein HU n=1 Tax=Deinococcus ruber TaxID=1848197 RepID=A0A918BX60_9DEIO|nr:MULTISPECIES: HU family DNA-binding protein [Deinococcus]ULH16568.1 HU family DNA-binding protein [Deinococcus sp. KNUC1210]GGQ96722.1 DNA-binding protein HU [Deinococcus ruber]